MRLNILVVSTLLLAAAGCQRTTELTVLHAASLRRALSDAAAAYQRANPKVKVRLEPSGSQVAIRKVTELGLKADVVAVADAALIDQMMVPEHAGWTLDFATNELVLAHLGHSRFADEVSEANWPEVLERPGVRLGRVDPDSAPLGYHTLFAWELAERSGRYGAAGEHLAARLLASVPKEAIATDESDLLSHLEAKAIDYAFLYRSTAEDHRLRSVALPDEVNLGRRELNPQYQVVATEVKTKGGAVSRLKGHAITYGLTIPNGAPNQVEAERFIGFLLGAEGKAILEGAGFRPLVPVGGRPLGRVPASLRALVGEGQ